MSPSVQTPGPHGPRGRKEAPAQHRGHRLRPEAQNLLCVYLAAAILVGLLGNALFELWWLDPAAALVVVTVALTEGRESWRGEASGMSAEPGRIAGAGAQAVTPLMASPR